MGAVEKGMTAFPEGRPVLVPLDGTERSASAIPVARALAKLLGATLHFVHVTGDILHPHEAPARLGLPREALRGAIVDTAGGQPAETIVRLARERQTALIVLSRRTTEEHGVAGLGSVAEAVLRGAPCPIVLVPPERRLEEPALRTVLLPHDGTRAMAAALAPAVTLVDRASADLFVLHVTGPGHAPTREPGALFAPRYVDQAHHEWPAWSREFLQRLGYAWPDLPRAHVRLLLGAGKPADEIVRFAALLHADLVALGWRGNLDAEHAATLKAVIERSSSPVLVAEMVE